MRTTDHREVKGYVGAVAPPPAPQRFLNGEFHDWYRIILGYSDHLVSGLIDQFGLRPGQRILDPFCGTGTTLVECMKRGLDSVGIDANPASYFAAKVKTNWNVDPTILLQLLARVERMYCRRIKDRNSYQSDPTYDYIVESGMLDRGWISPVPLRKAIIAKQSIASLTAPRAYKGVLALALVADVVASSSNIKFGPELYCSYEKDDADVWRGFASRVSSMGDDLRKVADLRRGRASVVLGDSRRATAFAASRSGKFDGVICSPPYPAEHDYTRNSRLELAFIEAVSDVESLRFIKRRMIRSHTKGIYHGDSDSELVARNRSINKLATTVEKRAKAKKHGFARLYGTVIREYFGGMRRHFRTIAPRLAPRASCAYVVGDQSSYLQVHIPTAELLAEIAELEGFKVVDIQHWRDRRASKTSKYINENVLVLRKLR